MKKCQRCSNSFHCQPKSIEQCGCSKISLAKQTQVFLKQTKYDCLCNACLVEVNEMVLQYAGHSLPANAQDLKEGEHFYFNAQGLFVMTEVYHYLRGFCCGNFCKHCAYGNRK